MARPHTTVVDEGARSGQAEPSAHSFLRSRRARQQPEWEDPVALQRVRTQLAARPPLVRPADVALLRAQLAVAAAGSAYVVQAGDCAEDLAECTAGYVQRKAGLIDVLAGTLKMIGHRPVIRAGRLAGQFAKPRSHTTETVNGQDLPVFRGHLVNGPEPDPAARRPDPDRMLLCYDAAQEAMTHLGWSDDDARWRLDPPVWTSHEALVIDYEAPQLRRDAQGRLFLASTHWPWIGARTGDPAGMHVAMLAAVANPVACKVSATTSARELVALCARLDPGREPGRLTLIARMGAAAVSEHLPPLVRAVRSAGHPVLWLTDPMHGNTRRTIENYKTRYLDAVTSEVRDFQCAVRGVGGVAAGLHLEVTPDQVTECVLDESHADRVGEKYTTLCDPRLNPEQAVTVVSAWRG
ncbi:3-deoxy-7-phosphoheptulonate synthase [Micromonospora sp. NPDC051196]|uniref:3-deoxy-7-phosphoheptulonate synthase n=1 Tax=Micromonospora sp. NPDC051196 TaxID=3155281 RepID=UPI00341843FE